MADSNPVKNSPFKDSLGAKKVPQKGSAGTYDGMKNLPAGMPSRTTSPAGVPEKYYDAAVTNANKSTPGTTGPIKPIFKDAVGKK